MLTPAIAALTLALYGHEAFSERLGVNGRYASLGNGLAAAVLGGVAYYWSERAVFIVATGLVVPALLSLTLFRSGDRIAAEDHPALLHPRERRRRRHRLWHVFLQALTGMVSNIIREGDPVLRGKPTTAA